MTVARWAGALLLFAALGCSRRDGAPAGEAGGTTANETGASATNEAHPELPSAPLVDTSQVGTCSVSHSCSLSHPGLGSSARGTRVDLGACTRTSWASSGPWKSGPDDTTPTAPAPPGKAKTPKVPEPTPNPVAPADCARLKSLVTSVTKADLRAADEPAKMDTEACQLYVECGSPPTQAFRVQRETTTGAGRVTDLIRAVYGLR